MEFARDYASTREISAAHPHMSKHIQVESGLSMTGSKTYKFFMSSPSQQDLVELKRLLEDGKVVPVIDRTYPLSEVPEALRYLEQGHARGKVVITV